MAVGGDCGTVFMKSLFGYIYFYYVYRSAFVRTARLLVATFLIVLLVVDFRLDSSIKFPLFFLSLFLIAEIFFRYKLSKVAPRLPLSQNDGKDLSLSTTRELLEVLVIKEKAFDVVAALLTTDQASFVIEKAHIAKQEIAAIAMSKDEVLAYAAKLANTTNGVLITSMDFVAAYILMAESQTKLLFNKQVKQEDFVDILLWARHTFRTEENPEKKRIHFLGSGIGEALTTGWTPETKNFTTDFSYIAYKLKPRSFGREKEFGELLEGLSRNDNNNVLLIGDPGSGKENLVALLAQASFDNTIKTGLNHIKVLELMIGPLIAGANNRGELETRLQAIIDEVSHSGNVILYIPEIQNITGSSAYNVDLSGALYPYLKEGRLPVIATVTVGNFKTYIEKSPLMEVMTSIRLEEPDKRTTKLMLLQKAEDIEEKYGVILTYKAIYAAVEYANRYFQDAALPGSAANLLEDVAHRYGTVGHGGAHMFGKKEPRYILAEDIVKSIEEKTHIAVAQPTGPEKELLLHLEDKMHERVIDQVDAIRAIAEAMRRLRAGLVSQKRPISFLFLGPTGVGKTETAKALATLYFRGEDKMIRLDMSEYSDEGGQKRLLGAAPGQGQERGELTDKIADNPFSLVLLDEFEKAHPKILDLFLQVLEDGRLTDNKGKTVNFVNSIIIATSNAGAEFIREEIQKAVPAGRQGAAVNKDFSKKLLDYLQSSHIMRPELLNRFDDVVIFKPLGEHEMLQITQLMLQEVVQRLQEQDVTFTYDEKLLAKVAREGYDQQFGARPLRRYIQDNVEDMLAQRRLRDEIGRGNSVFMTVGDDNTITVKVE